MFLGKNKGFIPAFNKIFKICWWFIAFLSHKLSGLNQHSFISSQFCRSEVWTALWGYMLSFSKGWNQSVGETELLPGGSREKSVPTFIQVVGGIKLFVVLGLGFLFLCWQSASGTRSSERLPAFLGSWLSLSSS